MSTAAHTPFVSLPYLPLRATCQIGKWLVIPIDQFTGPWLSEAYERRAKQLLKRFVGVNGQKIKEIPTVVSAEDGANGVVPNEIEGRALQLALDFASIDHTFTLSGDPLPRFMTTDNTELQIWPLAEVDGFIAYTTGRMMRTTHGGWDLDRDDWAIPCPLEVYMPLVKVYPDVPLASAIYEVVLKGATEADSITERRIATATGWWSKAWRNSVSVTWEDRIVLLKTAFEALLDTSSTEEAAKRLRHLFEEAASQSSNEVKGLLWSPSEQATQPHPFTGPRYSGKTVTNLEHWFLNFGSTRNAIIHDGQAPSLTYEWEDGSPYNGSLVMVGERVFREAIKMKLETLGYKGLWMTGLDRTIHDAMQELGDIDDA